MPQLAVRALGTTIDAMRGIRERLDQDVVVGAEGYLFELERRGYVKSGPFVPEVVLDFPDAVRELHREFLRAGAEVMVAFTYYGHREKLRAIGREDDLEPLNRHALRLAREVASEGDALVAGNICNTWVYDPEAPESSGETVREMYREQVRWAAEEGADLIISETHDYLGEALISLEVIQEFEPAVDRHVRLDETTDDRRVRVRRGVQAARGPRARTSSGSTARAVRRRCCRCWSGSGPRSTATSPRSRFPTGRRRRSRTSRR